MKDTIKAICPKCKTPVDMELVYFETGNSRAKSVTSRISCDCGYISKSKFI